MTESKHAANRQHASVRAWASDPHVTLGFSERQRQVLDLVNDYYRLRAALTEIRMLTVEVGDSVEAATRACDIAMEALGET